MDFIFDDEKPIYLQLIERVRLAIISGELPAGSRIPPVRELALQAHINPNTVQRALAELEESGLIYTERTNGKFVTEDPERIRREKENAARASLKRFREDLRRLAMTEEEIKALLKEEGPWSF